MVMTAPWKTLLDSMRRSFSKPEAGFSWDGMAGDGSRRFGEGRILKGRDRIG